MIDIRSEFVDGWGGTRLAVHRLGAGRPVILLHGLFSSAEINWIRYSHAERLAAAGFECLMPDLRAHGQSAAPHDAAAYPRDVLVRDLEAVISALGLADYDLGGFSLGARTAFRGVVEGLRPRRLVLGGMGLEGLTRWRGRGAFFIDVIDRFGTIARDDPAYFAQQFLKSTGVDRAAARLLLESLEGSEPGDFGAVDMPVLVVCGEDDRDNGSPEALAGQLADAVHVAVPGNHMTCVTRHQLGDAIVAFLSRPDRAAAS